jgi:hypothetical protein
MIQNFVGVFLAFKNARPKVFIRWKDDKLLGASQVLEQFVLERRQVWCDLMPLKLCLDLLEKAEDLCTKFNGDGGQVGLLVGTNEQLVGVIYIRGASKHHLSVDVTAKMF